MHYWRPRGEGGVCRLLARGGEGAVGLWPGGGRGGGAVGLWPGGGGGVCCRLLARGVCCRLVARGGGGGGAVGFWPGGCAVGFWPGGGGGGGGVPSGKEGRGGALYYVNGFTTAPGICPCVCEFSLTRLLIISRLFWRPLNPAPGDICAPLPPPSLRHC